ncbi:MAG TPA: thioredoxin family protein [Fimbriimonadaceae bacterium]|nr:thioredoxin family protein [Fimbriimonadaceae bacterium]
MLKKIQSSIVPLVVAVLFVIAGAAAIKSAAGSKLKPAGPSKVPFTTDSKAAFAQAKKEGKIVMVDFNADWCGPCQQMKREFFTKQEVADALTGVVAVDLNVDNPGDASDIADRYPVEAYPTLLFLDSNGKEIGRLVGYGGVDDQLRRVKAIIARS